MEPETATFEDSDSHMWVEFEVYRLAAAMGEFIQRTRGCRGARAKQSASGAFIFSLIVISIDDVVFADAIFDIDHLAQRSPLRHRRPSAFADVSLFPHGSWATDCELLMFVGVSPRTPVVTSRRIHSPPMTCNHAPIPRAIPRRPSSLLVFDSGKTRVLHRKAVGILRALIWAESIGIPTSCTRVLPTLDSSMRRLSVRQPRHRLHAALPVPYPAAGPCPYRRARLRPRTYTLILPRLTTFSLGCRHVQQRYRVARRPLDIPPSSLVAASWPSSSTYYSFTLDSR
ncbi:hypothetical protein C8R43DRAFT_1157093 [Mycena crocata]|nr:hypothetical protein C8R43DRAFT_1157093 [Mycena crocata]